MRLYSSKLGFDLDSCFSASRRFRLTGAAKPAIADGLSNDTVRDLRCLHPCGEYEKWKEKERRKKGEECAQSDKTLDGSRGKALRIIRKV